MAHDIEKKWRSKDVLLLESVDFSSMLLCDRVLAGLAKAGFKKPSPIQLEAIPLGRFGNDLLVQAKSGTGKTLVFVIVALEMLERKHFYPQVLIIVPTREIATQICSVVKSVGSYFSRMTCESFIGGLPVEDDVKKAHNCQIVVGTPGRLKQLIEMKALKTDTIRLLVFDEADEVLSFSWLEDIDFIFNSLRKSKQVIATSATYPPKLKKIIVKYQRDPRLVQIETKKLTLLGIIHYIKVVESSAMPIKQYQFKLAALGAILKSIKFTQCLVYCNGIHKVETLYRDIKKWGFSTTYISSNRDQADRLRAIDNLKRFKCKVLVSSNVTARGIDAENVDLVINFDVSNHTEVYLHRSGRAGRYGTIGATISLVDRFELKYIEKVEKEAQFKSYELPDPVPHNLIQNPVLDKYIIEESATIVENSKEDQSNINHEEQSLSVNGDNCASIVNSEQCDNQSNNESVTITDGDVEDSKIVNGVSVAAHVKSKASMKENSENHVSNNVESQDDYESCTVTKKSNENDTCMKTSHMSDGQNNSNNSESKSVISPLKNGKTKVVSRSENAKRPDASSNTMKNSIIINEDDDKENAEYLDNKENHLVGANENSSIVNIKESSPECEISEVLNARNTRKNLVGVNKDSSKINVIQTSPLPASEEIAKGSSEGDNSKFQFSNSEVACAKNSEKHVVSSDENYSGISDKQCCTSSANEPDLEISLQLDCPSDSQRNEAQSMNEFGKNEIDMAVENYIQKYENKEQTVQDKKDSTEFESSSTEIFVNKNISLDNIRNLNSRRSEHCYKVLKLYQEVKSSKHRERVEKALKKKDVSSADKENSIQEPMPCSEASSVEIHSTNNIPNELSPENVNELEIGNSLEVLNTSAQEGDSEIGNAADILNFHVSPCHESTPHLEKSKSKVTKLNRGASEPPGIEEMSIFNQVSEESASEIESHYETTQSATCSRSPSDSESDSDSCSDSSSSSDSDSSSSSTETSSSESHSSVDSLSVHSIEYRSRRDMKSLKHPHCNVFKQGKASLKEHHQRHHSVYADKRQQYHSKSHPSHCYDFFSNFHQHSEGVNYSNAYGGLNQVSYSNDNQVSSNSQHFHSKKYKNMHQSRNDFPQFSCNGQHTPACFMPTEHRCHPYQDNVPCNQRAVCDQWYQIFRSQWQHIQNCSKINY